MKPRIALLSAALSLALAGAVIPAVTATAATVETVNGCVSSVPEPATTAPVSICYSLFRPVEATATERVPVIMHSHGWGGSRTTTAASFQKWLDAGYGVLSFDQRGWGESGGKAHVEHPELEGEDVLRLVDLLGSLPWVQKDGQNDPKLGAIGGSYGGGYQFVGAFRALQTRGKPLFDALAPEITWYDLSESLAPSGVVRTEWALALSAAALPADALESMVITALAYGAATGTWPDGSVPGTPNMVAYFEKNGPKWHVSQGRRLDIPVLFGQGTTDTLFPLQQGFANWKNAITDKARARSIFVAYNGGHTLPAVLPPGAVSANSDPCSTMLAGGSFSDLALRFMDERLRGQSTGLTGYGKYHLATAGGTCTTVSSVEPNTTLPAGTVATTSAVGVPVYFKVATGPIRIAGSPYLTGTMTALGLNNRAFYGLAVGTSPLDAKLVQNNVLPVNELLPVLGATRRIALPSVAIDVPAGQSLFLMASAFSDTFLGMGSRTPGAITLTGAAVQLPVVP